MAKIKVIQNASLPNWLQDELNKKYDVFHLWKTNEEDPLFIQNKQSYQAIVTRAAVGASQQLVSNLPNLRVISSFGVGLDQFDLDHLNQRNIQLGFTPEVLNDCVADLAWGLLINVSRQIVAADRYVRQGNWKQKNYPLTSRVSGKKIGIVGLGRIGQAIAKRAIGFDMEVRYHNRHRLNDCIYNHEPSLVNLAKWSDFLVIAVSGGKTSDCLIDKEVLLALGENSYLINISRGSVVDEKALLEALKNKKIAGAGLDVYVDEPNISADIIGLDNVVLSPHMASATTETRQEMSELTLKNLDDYFKFGRVSVGD